MCAGSGRPGSTYAVLLDTLNRHRGKGQQQKVTVEHVHVHTKRLAILFAPPVPIHQVAEALDIVEIRQAPLKGLEGALVCIGF
jgi:hypothetical protein